MCILYSVSLCSSKLELCLNYLESLTESVSLCLNDKASSMYSLKEL